MDHLGLFNHFFKLGKNSLIISGKDTYRALGINRNEKLYAGLEAIVEGGSFCGVFGRLCVACERPYRIEIDDRVFTLMFPDGEVLSNREWKRQ